MADVKLEVNKRIDVVWNDKLYKSSLQDLGDQFIAIATPITGGVYLPLHKGDSFIAYYYIDDKLLYEFDGVVTGRRQEEKIQLIVLEYPKRLTLVQRREFVRVDIHQPVRYVISKLDKELKTVDAHFDGAGGITKEGVLLDISGGGVRIRTAEKLERGEYITVDMNISGRSLRLNGKIIRCVPDENKGYATGVAFYEMSERTQDKIVQLIFEIMRKQLKST